MKFLGLISLLFSVNAFALQGNNCTITTQSDFGASTVSTKILSTNKYRRCLMFQNTSASTIYIKFGSAHTGTENAQIATGTRWEPMVIPVGSVYVKSANGVANLTVLEGN